MPARFSNAAPAASLVVAAAGWGLGTVLSKLALAYVPPLTLLVTQLTASVLALWLLLALQRTRLPWGRGLVPLALLGWLNPGLAYALSLVGLSLTTASASAVLWALEPVLIVGLAWLVLRERMTLWFWLLSALAAVGVLLVIGADPGQPGLLLGNGLIFLGVLVCALYTVLARRLGGEVSLLLVVALQESVALAGALLIWPLELTRGGYALAAIPPAAWLLAAGAGLVYYGLAFWFYLHGLRRMPASQAGIYINLVPLFALAGAYLLLGESLAPAQWLGCGLVVVAVAGLSARAIAPAAVGA